MRAAGSLRRKAASTASALPRRVGTWRRSSPSAECVAILRATAGVRANDRNSKAVLYPSWQRA